jgi:adenylate cyclase
MRRLSLSPLILVTLAVALAAMVELFSLHLLLPLENRLSDFFVKTCALGLQADPDIVIVDIDEKSMALMADEAGSWPWPRSVHGELVAGIERQRPRAVVFDITFSDRDKFRPQSDEAFNQALAATSNTYFPMVRLPANGDHVGVPLKLFPPLTGVSATTAAEPEARVAMEMPLALDPSSWRLGAINFREDGDGVGRRYDLFIPAYGWRIPSLPARVAHDLGYAVPDRQQITLGWRGKALSYRRISYVDLFQDFNRQHPKRPQDELTGKIVLVGSSAPSLVDVRHTPMSGRHEAMDIVATAIDNLKNQGFFRTAPPYVAPALALALLATLLWAFFRYPRRAIAIGVMLAATTLLLLGLGYFAVTRQWLLPVLVPLLAGWTFYFAAALRKYLDERKAREQAVQMFNRFLDPRVVNELVEQGTTPDSLSGERRSITVLFSDIRNFTTYSEAHQDKEVVAMLNQYFSLQTEVIFRHGGTLDKFIGDAIMAFWGAPADDPLQAANAVAAALEMAERLQDFKRDFGAAGASFDVGIGIHSGPAVVGFIGSQRRQDYTAIGDTVNLSSRIEGQTKGVARILVSDETRALCADRFDFVDHGFYKVKGRTQEVHLFEPREKST